MRIAVVNTSRSRVQKNFEYYIYTIKSFVEYRSNDNFNVDIINIFMSDDSSTSAQLIDNNRYDVVLFRLLFWNIDYVYSVIEKLKDPIAVTGVWGHDSYMYPEEYFKHRVKFIMHDEPELSLYEVAALVNEKELDSSKASGVILKNELEKTLVYGSNRVLENIDFIPSPYTNGLIEIDKETSVYWEISRGCLFRCDFCVEFSHMGKVRYHSFNYLEDELKFFKKTGISHIILGSPLFNLSHQHVKKILGMIAKYLPEAKIELQVRPDILSREEIDMLSDMNVYLNFGIQTFNKKVLENIMTSLNIESALATIRYINNYPGLPFGLDIIAGLPKIDFQDFLEDVEQAFQLWPINLNVYRLSLYPGTRIFNRIRELEYNVETAYPYRIVQSKGFSKRELEKSDEIAEGINTLYNKGRLVSIFTIICKTLGLKTYDVIEKWNKWSRKNEIKNVEEEEDIDFEVLFTNIVDFFTYMFERYQKRKLWPLVNDLLYHNAYYTSSLMTEAEDHITYPYQLDELKDSSVIGINKSVFIKRFSYDIEDLVNAGYIDVKDYIAEADKENLYGVIYRLDGGVFTSTISDVEGELFIYLQEHGEITYKELAEMHSDYEMLDVVSGWCDEGVLYMKSASK